MQITGKITQTEQPDFTDRHQNLHQNIAITAADSTIYTGRIGSKRGYNGGEQITVTATQEKREDGSLWTRFRRVDPQQQGSQNVQQGVSGGQGRPNGSPPDWKAISEGKVRHGLVCSGIESGQIQINKESPIADILYWAEFIMTGKAPLPPGQGQQSPDQHAQNDYDYKPQQDEIPY